MKTIRFGGSATVGKKISYVIGLCLGLVVAVAATGIIQMQSINAEIEGIAERDVPLTNAVTAITIHQLEQAINFERALRYGEEMKTDSHARASFEKAVHEFESLTAKVDKELKEGEELAKNAAEHAATAAERAEFEHVLKLLTKIEHEHAGYEEHAITALKLMAAGNVAKAVKLAEKIEVEEEELDHELESLLVEIEKFTEEAAKTAQIHEQFAVKLMIAVSVGGFIVVALLAWLLIKHTISGPLGVVSRALEALTAGNYSVEVAVKSDDEIGKVAKALETFKQAMLENQRLQEERAANDRKAAEEKARTDAELAKAEVKATEDKARDDAEKREAEERQRGDEASRAEEKRHAEEHQAEERRQAEQQAAEEKSQAEERARQDRRKAMIELADNFESKVGAVIKAVAESASEMQSAAQAMAKTAEVTSQQSSTVAAASEQQTNNVQMVAAATEELTASITEISSQVSQSATMY